MRFHYGPPPEDPQFQPLSQGWQSIREPGPILVQVIAIPVAVLAFLGLGMVITLIVGSSPFPLILSFEALLWFIGLIPLHELLHLLAHPDFGCSHRSVVGVWISRLLFYAVYLGPMRHARFLTALAAPFVILSLAPLLVIALGRAIPLSGESLHSLTLLSLVNGVASAGDLVGLGLVGFQVPRGAILKDKGWKTYWKLGDGR